MPVERTTWLSAHIHRVMRNTKLKTEVQQNTRTLTLCGSQHDLGKHVTKHMYKEKQENPTHCVILQRFPVLAECTTSKEGDESLIKSD